MQTVKRMVIIGSILALSACAATNLQDSWQSENLHKHDFDKVLVVALAPNISNRILFELKFAEIFSNRGVDAVASHTVMGDTLPKREDVEAYVKDKDIKYLLVTKMGGVDVNKDYVPPKSVTYYSGPYYPTYGHYWNDPGVTLSQAEYNITSYNIVLVTSIYDVNSEELVWVGRSKTFDAESVSNIAKDLAQAIDNEIHR